MARSGSVSHCGSFSTRVAPVRKHLSGENIGASFPTFAYCSSRRGFARALRKPPDGRHRRVGVAAVANPASPY